MLSGVAHDIELTAISTFTRIWIQEVVKFYELDPKAQELLREFAVQSPNSHGFCLKNGLIYKQHQLVVGQNLGLQNKLVVAFHSSAVGGHSGIFITKKN